jgi:hypothetical protein
MQMDTKLIMNGRKNSPKYGHGHSPKEENVSRRRRRRETLMMFTQLQLVLVVLFWGFYFAAAIWLLLLTWYIIMSEHVHVFPVAANTCLVATTSRSALGFVQSPVLSLLWALYPEIKYAGRATNHLNLVPSFHNERSFVSTIWANSARYRIYWKGLQFENP